MEDQNFIRDTSYIRRRRDRALASKTEAPDLPHQIFRKINFFAKLLENFFTQNLSVDYRHM